ncbi:hypothetical protein [Aeribacillus composti]
MNTVEAESAFINSSAIAYTKKEKVPQPDGPVPFRFVTRPI